jgi:hypothetical protein
MHIGLRKNDSFYRLVLFIWFGVTAVI